MLHSLSNMVFWKRILPMQIFKNTDLCVSAIAFRWIKQRLFCFCGIFQVAAVVKVCYIGRQTSKVKVAFVTRLKHAMQKRKLIQPFHIVLFTQRMHLLSNGSWMKATLYCEFEKFKVHRSSCQLTKILNNWTALFMNLSISSCIEALMVA